MASLRALATVNANANLAKVGLDDDGDAFLRIDLPSRGFSYELFQLALHTIASAADEWIVPLLQAKAVDERNQT